LLTTYPDKAKMRNMLSYRTCQDADSAYHYVVPVRIHTNGGFFGDWHIVENGDANYVKRLGKDPNGALYKMYNTFTDVSDYTISGAEAEKKTRKTEGNAGHKGSFRWSCPGGHGRDPHQFPVRQLECPADGQLPGVKGHHCRRRLLHKNYYFYRDTEGTGEWEGFPWDVDLSWGRQWNSTDTYWNNNLVGVNNGINVGGNNGVFTQNLSGNPQTQQMYLRRIRTIMDEQLGNTNSLNTNFEAQIAYWLS
jgi:spore coat protein CotH